MQEKVKSVILNAVEVTSEMYELRVRYNWNQTQKEQEPNKHVKISASIDPIVSKPNKIIDTDGEDEKKTHEKLQLIAN